MEIAHYRDRSKPNFETLYPLNVIK